MANLLEGLLKTPQQIRDEQLRGLDEQGMAQAKLMTPGQTPFANWGAGQVARMPSSMNQAVRMGGQAAGSLASAVGASPEMINKLNQIGVSAEERQAMKMQDILKQAKGDAKGLRAAAQQLIKEGDPKNAYALLAMVKDLEKETGADILDTNDNKNILFIAKNQLKCDINDPKCLAQAREIYIDTKRADTAKDRMEVEGYKNLTTQRDEATGLRQSLLTINDSLEVLDSGNVNIGAFPKTRQGAMRFMSQVFNIPSMEDTVTRTDALLTRTGQLAGELLSSGMYGSGTAISEKDLENAQKLAGASANLTPQAVKEILELNAKMMQTKLEFYNKRIESYSGEFYARTPERSVDKFRVPVPALYRTKNIRGLDEKPKVDTVSVLEESMGMMVEVPVGSTIGTYKGKRGYSVDGKFYTFDGQEVN